jgi:cytosine/adenosine deaminase-related metal-dependent hydrolase
MKTKIQAKYIIGHLNHDHVIFKNAEIVYQDESILFVGHDYPGEVDRVIVAGEAIVSPGFIDLNALGDIDHDLVHQEVLAELQKSLLWSEEYFLNGRREWMTAEDEAFKSLYAYLHLIRNGITTAMPITSVLYKQWGETVAELSAAAENASRLGLRVYLGPSYQSGMRVIQPDGTIALRWDEALGWAGLDRAVKFVERFDGAYSGLVRGMLAPERIETIAPDLLIESRRRADELNCPIRLHAAQGEFEYAEMQRRHAKTPIRFLYDLGFLGQRVSIPHSIYINSYSGVANGAGDDLALLSETGATVIHCPVIMTRHGQALESFNRYAQAGVNLALGTDTFPPDMFQNIRIGSYLARVMDKSIIGNSFAALFRAATLGGAQALGRNDLGRLAPGAKADLIIVKLGDFHFGPQDDPIRTLMNSASGLDVSTVVINGKTVMKDRVVAGIDLVEVQKTGQAYYEKMRASYLERDYLHHSPQELFPPSFPIMERKESFPA